MELDATTFVLEIVNFLVLLWVLNRLLYRPIKAALAKRVQEQADQKQAMEAQQCAIDEQARKLEQAQTELDARRERAKSDLAAEINAMRQKRLTELTRELDTEREKIRARTARQQQDTLAQQDRELRERAAGFVAEYLTRLASPALEAAVVDLFLSDLDRQTETARAALRDGWSDRGEQPPDVEVSTAYAPPEAMRAHIEAVICSLMGAKARTVWRLDSHLLAGICVHLPGHQLEASLRRGVDVFAAPST